MLTATPPEEKMAKLGARSPPPALPRSVTRITERKNAASCAFPGVVMLLLITAAFSHLSISELCL